MSGIEDAVKLYESGVSEHELFAGLGKNDPDVLAFEETTEAQDFTSGVHWWTERQVEIREMVCKALSNKEGVGVVAKDLVALIFGVLGAKYGGGIATYLAVIVVRRVVEGWCADSMV
jgi:hypothetical protein